MCRNFFPGISGGVLTPLTPPWIRHCAETILGPPAVYPRYGGDFCGAWAQRVIDDAQFIVVCFIYTI